MANIKFSAFNTETNSANVDFLVGYQGTTMKKIAPSNLGGSYPFSIDGTSLYSGFVPGSLSGSPAGNTILGMDAGLAMTTGSSNTLLGHDAGKAITTAVNNTIVGFNSGITINGTGNTVLGMEAGTNLATAAAVNLGWLAGSVGNYSISIGSQAGRFATNTYSVFIGEQAGYNASSGDGAIGIGNDALRTNTADGNIAIGRDAGYSQTSGASNTNVGYRAGYQSTTNGYRTYVGYEAGRYNDGASNTGIGYRACNGYFSFGTGQGKGANNTGVGYEALAAMNGIGAASNTAVGANALGGVITGANNTALGKDSGSTITSGSNLTVLGYDAEPSSNTATNEITLGNSSVAALRIPGLQSGASDGDVLTFASGTGLITLQAAGGGGATSLNGLTDCLVDTDSLYVGESPSSLSGNPQGNTTLGIDCGIALTTGFDNTFIGRDAAKAMTDSDYMVVIGSEACAASASNGDKCVVIGAQAHGSSMGSQGVAIGYQAQNLSGVGKCVTVGYQAARANSGASSTLIGYEAGESNQAAGAVYVGYEAGTSNTSGTKNTNLGYQAGTGITTDGSNTNVGYEAGAASIGANNTFIGEGAGKGYNTGSSTAGDNIAIGVDAMNQRRGGSGGNTVIGNRAYKNTDGGVENIVIGKDAVPTATTGSNNVVIGTSADLAAQTDNNSIIIGNAGVGLGTNTTVLGNSSTTTTVIKGNVGLLDATSPGSALDILSATNGTDSVQVRLRTTAVSANTLQKVVGFYQASTSERGYIGVNQYAVSYNTSSDYRLKENIVEINDGISRLKSLKPCRFNFISPVDENGNKLDPNPKTLDGFIAHESQAVIPECVSGDKDAVDEDGKPVYQGIDQSKMVPLLTAALKEAVTKIEQLETRIQTLENN